MTLTHHEKQTLRAIIRYLDQRRRMYEKRKSLHDKHDRWIKLLEAICGD